MISIVNGAPLKIPTLATRRLRLEPLSTSHSPGLFDLWSDAEVCRYAGTVRDHDGKVIDMPAASRAESDRILDFWLKAAADGRGFRWAALLRASRESFAGTIGFNALGDCAEIAFHLLPRYWGRGLMTEASAAAIAWQRGNGASEIEAFIEPENAASIALALRLGMSATEAYSQGARRYRLAVSYPPIGFERDTAGACQSRRGGDDDPDRGR